MRIHRSRAQPPLPPPSLNSLNPFSFAGQGSSQNCKAESQAADLRRRPRLGPPSLPAQRSVAQAAAWRRCSWLLPLRIRWRRPRLQRRLLLLTRTVLPLLVIIISSRVSLLLFASTRRFC